MRNFGFQLLVLILPGLVSAQSIVGEWDSYTSVLDVRDIINDGDYVYGASSGGLVAFNKFTEQFEIYTVRDGLTRNDIACIAEDKLGDIWLGMNSPDGEINIWDKPTKTVKKVFTGMSFGDDLTSIVSITFSDNIAFAAYQLNVDWGIAYFKVVNSEYIYQDRFEVFREQISGINSITVVRDTLWISTYSGLQFADLAEFNGMKSGEAWHSVSFPAPGNVTELVEYNRKIIVGMGKELYEIRNGQSVLLDSSSGWNINDLITDHDGSLYANTGSRLLRFSSTSWTQVASGQMTKCAYDAEGILWCGSDSRTMWKCQDGQARYFTPNTIMDNIYTALWINPDGSLFAGTQKGFSLLTDRGWYNVRGSYNMISIHDDMERDWNHFVADTIAYSLTSAGRIYNLVRNSNGDYFAPQYGSNLDYVTGSGFVVDYLKAGGLMEFNLDNLSNYELYDTTEHKLAASEGRGGNAHYLGIGYIALDADENLWIANQYAQNDNVIAVLTHDKQWQHFSIDDSHGYLNYHTTSIIFDDEGRVWFASEVHSGETPSPAAGGIIVLDYKNTLFDKTDDDWYWIDTNDGLANNAVYALAFDRERDLWIMTSDGIQKALVASNFPDRIFSQIDKAVLTSLPFAKECRIKVDDRNNKWITTVGFGVKVYTYNGIWFNDVEGFTSENSGLLSNTVLDIAFNNEEGLVYLATNKGISVYRSAYAVYGDEYRELKIFPMPYEIPSPRPLTIDGLLQESDVKILTLDGTFIRHLSDLKGNVIGQQAYWDGKDHRGRYVSSGVYLCMAYTREGDTTVGKIAVIRK